MILPPNPSPTFPLFQIVVNRTVVIQIRNLGNHPLLFPLLYPVSPPFKYIVP